MPAGSSRQPGQNAAQASGFPYSVLTSVVGETLVYPITLRLLERLLERLCNSTTALTLQRYNSVTLVTVTLVTVALAL